MLRGRAAGPATGPSQGGESGCGGARVERLHWWANPVDAGWERSVGMMVNYYYEPSSIETNRDRYVQEGTVNASDAIKKLAAQDG